MFDLQHLISELDRLGINRLREAVELRRQYLLSLDVEAELKKLDEFEAKL